jgi:hypothetical protein
MRDIDRRNPLPRRAPDAALAAVDLPNNKVLPFDVTPGFCISQPRKDARAASFQSDDREKVSSSQIFQLTQM